MDKNPRDMIVRATQSLLEMAKITATTNVVNACRAKQLDISAEQLEKLLFVVTSSIEEGHSKAARAFSRSVDEALAVPKPHIAPAKKKPA